MIALFSLFLTMQQSEQSYDGTQVRSKLHLSLLCSDKAGGGSGTIDFVPAENLPTLRAHFRSEPTFFEDGYVVSGTWKSRPSGKAFEVVLKGHSYGKDATLSFFAPLNRDALDAEARLKVGAEDERAIACLIGPPPPPGASQ
jgi:hypothetical protein